MALSPSTVRPWGKRKDRWTPGRAEADKVYSGTLTGRALHASPPPAGSGPRSPPQSPPAGSLPRGRAFPEQPAASPGPGRTRRRARRAPPGGQRARGRPAGVLAAGREARPPCAPPPPPLPRPPSEHPSARVRLPAQGRQGWWRPPAPRGGVGSPGAQGARARDGGRGGVPGAGRSPGWADRSPSKRMTGEDPGC